MKSIQNGDNININNQNSNMFGFSFSPQMNISVPSSVAVIAEAVNPPSFYYHHPTPLHNYGFYYGLEGEHVGLFSPLPMIMPDGSIYGIEALSRSHAQAMEPTLTTQLGNFLGNQSMAIPQYECNTKEAMQLNIDNLFYNPTLRFHKPNINPNNLNHVQENMSLLQSLRERQEQQLCNYTALRNHDVMLEGSMKNQLKDSVHFPNIVEDKISDLNRWVSRDFHDASSHAENSKTHGLNMSPSSQSSCVTSSQQTVFRNTLGQRTSQYRGVTRHRWTGRYEAHLWDNSCRKEGQARKGKQVYLGGYDMEEKAARAYDMAALKYWGPSTRINFPLENYQKELEEMNKMTRLEYVAHLRRKSSGFSRGASMYRGVTRHHQHGRWQARIGRVAGNKDLYLGTYTTQEEAAEAYDIAAIKFRGPNAVTNFDITIYDVQKIIASNNLLNSEEAKRNRNVNDVINNKTCTFEDIEEAIPIQKRCKIQSFSEEISNPSSLVTSLCSSREESPERTSLPMLFGMTSTTTLPSFSLPQMSLMSVFDAWNDA